MNFYQEITLLGSSVGASFLLSKAFYQVHLAIVDYSNRQEEGSKIGISFPAYNTKSLGDKLRLFSPNEEILQQLNLKKWLQRLDDYTHTTSIRSIPRGGVTGYSFYKRKQTKSSLERLIKRKVKRESISYEQAQKRLKLIGVQERYSKLPFINMQSVTTGQKFKLFIVKEKADSLTGQLFGSYGLSATSSVPEF